MRLRLVFTGGQGLTGAVIRFGTWSPAAHVGGLLDDSGIVLDATPSLGVAEHVGIVGPVVGMFRVNCPADTEAAAVAWARRQIGRPYDWSAIAGFFLRHDMEDPRAWFCMELWLMAFAKVGFPLLNLDHIDRGSPRDGMLSPRLIEEPVSDRLRQALAVR